MNWLKIDLKENKPKMLHRYLFAIIFTALNMASAHSLAATLTIKVEGIKEIKGTLRIAVVDSGQRYQSVLDGSGSAYLEETWPVRASTAEVTIPELPQGDYGLLIFQDLNDNEKLDTNLVGIPSEPFGFSNNPRILIGPPGFEAIRFSISSPNPSISLNCSKFLW